MKNTSVYIEEQYDLFERLFNKKVDEDEKLIIRNAFLNGYELGKNDKREQIINNIKYYSE